MGTGAGTSVSEMVTIVNEVAGVQLAIKHVPRRS